MGGGGGNEIQKEERNKDRPTKIVHVKQNKHSLCGKIPAGLLPPPPQLVTADPPESFSPGPLLKHDSRGGNKTRASGVSKHKTNYPPTVT